MSSDRLFILSQYLLPQHLLSRLVGKLAASTRPSIKDTFIRRFAARYQIDMTEAAQPDLGAYASFNDFFTRALKPGARPIDSTPGSIVSPADGAISQLGPIDGDLIFQAKGHEYRLADLLASDDDARAYADGHFATIYLSPRDYHRVHMPYGGRLVKTVYVPGQLFSVNTTTAESVPGLFARNERLVCHFETDIGPMVVVLVGAMIVASMATVWGGLEPIGRDIRSQLHDGPVLAKGDEMGRFLLGSTAILLFPQGAMRWLPGLVAGSAVRMGGKMGHTNP